MGPFSRDYGIIITDSQATSYIPGSMDGLFASILMRGCAVIFLILWKRSRTSEEWLRSKM